jgi:hypothetical protein
MNADSGADFCCLAFGGENQRSSAYYYLFVVTLPS